MSFQSFWRRSLVLAVGLLSLCRLDCRGHDAHLDPSTEAGISLYNEVAAEIAAKGALVNIDEKKYMRWLLPQDVTRLYNAVVLLTAPVHICETCKPLEETFGQVANEFFKAGAMKLDLKYPNAPLPLLFFMIDAMKHAKIPYIHELTTAPTMAIIDMRRMKRVKADQGAALFKYIIPSSDLYTTMLLSKISAAEMIRWLNNHSNFNVEMDKSFMDKLGITGLLMTLLCLVSFTIWKMSNVLRTYPWIMGLGALGIQWLSTAGLFWSLLHTMRLFGYDRHSMKPVYIMPNRRHQFLGEGIVMSLCSVLFGSILLIIVRIAKSKAARGVLSLWAIGLLMITWLLYTMIFKAYVLKTGHDMSGIFPPPHFSTGSLINDRGNSF